MSKALNWMNRHKLSGVWAPLLLCLGMAAHFIAHFRMERAHRQFEFMDRITVRHIVLIDYVHDHPWFMLGYGLVFLAALIWIEHRAWPRWLVWLTVVLLAPGLLDYTWACLSLGTRFAVYSG